MINKNKRYGENASKQVKITGQKTEYFIRRQILMAPY
jgi:hypothetical protein